jgi:ABC-2 type transport system permease protein
MGAAAWRQYRLERRMFWRNPSAAFFNFLLPLLFLALFGAVFAGDQKNLNIIVPGIAGMSVMSTAHRWAPRPTWPESRCRRSPTR